MRRNAAFFLIVSGLAVAGFLGGGFASAGVHTCAPGSPCAPGTGTYTAPATTVAPAPKPIVKLSAAAIDFGADLTISGNVPGASAGQTVHIYSQSCGFTQPLPTGKTTTQAGGSYSFVLQPMQNATFYVRSGNGTSAGKAVRIRPRVQLHRASSSTFVVDISAGGGSYFKTSVTMERYDKARRSWRSVATGTLHPNSDPASIVAVSSATIRAHVPAGSTLRASATQRAVGKCFLPAKSASVTA